MSQHALPHVALGRSRHVRGRRNEIDNGPVAFATSSVRPIAGAAGFIAGLGDCRDFMRLAFGPGAQLVAGDHAEADHLVPDPLDFGERQTPAMRDELEVEPRDRAVVL